MSLFVTVKLTALYEVSFVVSICKGLKDEVSDNLPTFSFLYSRFFYYLAHFSKQIVNTNKITFKLIKNVSLKVHSFFIHLYILIRSYNINEQQNKKKDGNLYPHNGELC